MLDIYGLGYQDVVSFKRCHNVPTTVESVDIDSADPKPVGRAVIKLKLVGDYLTKFD